MTVEDQLFPAHAGMNRSGFQDPCEYRSVPRTRGDEPKCGLKDFDTPICSPHTRG